MPAIEDEEGNIISAEVVKERIDGNHYRDPPPRHQGRNQWWLERRLPALFGQPY